MELGEELGRKALNARKKGLAAPLVGTFLEVNFLATAILTLAATAARHKLYPRFS